MVIENRWLTAYEKGLPFCLVVSIGVHFVIICLWYIAELKNQNDDVFLSPVEVALVYDDMLTPASKKGGALPRVNQNLLPQLPKNYSIDESKADNENIVESQRMDGHKLEKNPALVTDVALKKQKDEIEYANKLKKSEALRRLMKQLALKKLQESETPSPALSAEEGDGDIAPTLGAGEIDLNKNIKIRIYKGRLAYLIERNWKYSRMMFKAVRKAAGVDITVDATGKIIHTQLVKTSGDEDFDTIVIAAIRKSSPLPKPPKKLVSKVIRLNFRPPVVDGTAVVKG